MTSGMLLDNIWDMGDITPGLVRYPLDLVLREHNKWGNGGTRNVSHTETQL